jgi:hypothetical protein
MAIGKTSVRLPSAPYAQDAVFELSWHKLMFHHVKVYILQQWIMSYSKVYQATLKLSELSFNTGSRIWYRI